MNGRHALRWIALGVFLSGAGCAEPPANLLIVSVDTLRSDHTSAYGYERETTPRLVRVAQEGARFEIAYSPAASTAPSHATLFTGRYPLGHGVVKNGLVLPAQHETLAEHLATRGYQTAGIAGSFVLDPRFGLARGFGHYDAEFRESSVRANFEWEGFEVPHFDRRAAETTTVAVRWLREERDPRKPFFLFVHYFDPHAPYAPPEAHARHFAERERRGNERAEKIDRYDGEVAYTDFEIGRLLDALGELGLRDRTLLVITADHGEGLGDHGFSQHALYLYEEAVRIPLIVRFPGVVPAGRRLGGPVELVDVVPTVLELLSLDGFAATLPGRSLAPSLRTGGPLDPNRSVFLLRRPYESGSVGVDGGRVRVRGVKLAVREGRWKLIANEGNARELYDLEADPGEARNQLSAEPEVALRLAQRLAEWRARHERPRAEPSIGDADRRGLEALGYTD